MAFEIAVLAVVVVLVVVGVAYGLGVYLRRRADDVPPAAPPVSAPRRPAAPSKVSAPSMRAEPADRELRVVINWLLNQAFEQTGIRVADDKLAYDRIVQASRKAIDELKTAEATEISLPFLTADASGPKHLAARLTRDMIAELVKY